MLTDHERLLYFWELRTRIDYAQRAWGQASDALDGNDVDLFWYYVESFLANAIGAANLLWPSKQKPAVQNRAGDLRSALSVGADAPDGLRDVRNGFEHFDERIDRWRETSTNHNFIDTMIGSSADVQGVPASDFARWFDPVTRELAVFGESTSIDAVLAELRAIRSVVPSRY